MSASALSFSVPVRCPGTQIPDGSPASGQPVPCSPHGTGVFACTCSHPVVQCEVPGPGSPPIRLVEATGAGHTRPCRAGAGLPYLNRGLGRAALSKGDCSVPGAAGAVRGGAVIRQSRGLSCVLTRRTARADRVSTQGVSRRPSGLALPRCQSPAMSALAGTWLAADARRPTH